MHKNKNFLFLFFLLLLSVGAFLFVSKVGAQTSTPPPAQGLQYTLLEKIPGFASTDGSNLPEYVKAIYGVALAVVVLSALFMLTVGGFMYLTSAGNTSAMGTAKGVIFDSIIGLVIALTAWLLLNVINPDLVNVTINGLSAIPMAPAPGAAPVTPGPSIPAGAPWPSDASERASLGSNFSYNRGANNCKTAGESACTSIAGSAAINALKTLQAACGCSIMINGGTEYWNHGDKKTPASTHHSPGDYAIDLNRDGPITPYITSNGTKICESKGRPVYKISSVPNAVFWDEDAKHWHVNFNNTTCSSL